MATHTNGVANGVHPAAVEELNGTNGTHSTPAHPAFDSIPDTIEAFANGEFVIVLDSPSRENEGDLIIAASALTPSKCAFLIRYTSGYLCAPITNTLADKLQLPLMVPATAASDPNRTAYTVTIDAEHPAMSTGISAADRSLTCQTLADKAVKASSFRRPGHIVPLRAKDGLVRERRGHTEAAVELCRLAGVPLVGVIGEMIKDGEELVAEGGKPKTEFEGSGMMRRDDCLAFGRRWGIKVCTIEDLVSWVEEKEGVLEGVKGVDY